ncbi:MAG: hypothetical protein WC588_00565 [Candidatus Micrarchaeia archaeon]
MAFSQKATNLNEARSGLMREFAKIGFHPALGSYADRYGGNAPSMSVFSRAMGPGGSPNAKSSYNVILFEDKGCLRAMMANPEESRSAAQLGFDRLITCFKYSGGKGQEAFISNVIRAAEENSALKPALSYRIFLHNHLSEIGGVPLNVVDGMQDDGRSSDRAFLANAILFNADIAIVTCHNHFPDMGWRKFSDEAGKYGISVVPGFEATLPLSESIPCDIPNRGKIPNPNGPHVLLLFDSPSLASRFWGENFSIRPYEYAPCASQGVELLRIYDIIDNGEEYRGKVARLIAHPACDVGLPDVGIVNRLAKGEISLSDMVGIFRRSQGIGHFNAAVGTAPLDFDAYKKDVERCSHFSDAEKSRRLANISESEAFMRELLIRQGLGRALSPNNINIAIAKEFTSKDGPIGFMDTDGHNFDWFYTRAGPLFWFNRALGPFAAGHNWIRLKGLPKVRPDAKWMVEFLHGMHKDEIEEGKPKVYAASTKDGISIVDPNRAAASIPQKIVNALESFYYYTHKQGRVLASDYFKKLIKKGELTDIACGSVPPENIFHI